MPHAVSPRLAALMIAVAALTAGAALAEQYPPAVYQDLRWRPLGPPRGGRTRAIAGVPGQPNVFYLGAVNGGVWKTTDAGRSWQPIFDEQPTQSIGAIAIAPSDPNVIYVGSGEGLYRPDLSVGDGVYRSADGGRHWTHLGLADAEQIPELAVDPREPDRVYAAVLGHPYGPSTERGIYRSLDGGRSWQQVLYKDENTGGNAVVVDPRHPEVVYASLWEARLGPAEDHNEWSGTGGGLYKSVDGGTSWRRLGAGLPPNAAQIGLVLAPSAPERLYAMVGSTESGDYASAAGLGLYRSDDGGEHWRHVNEDPRPVLRIGGGDLPVVRVDPHDPDVLYSASIVAQKSTDGGRSWTPLRGAPGGDDYQNVWISPADGRVIALASDQGAIVSVNGGETWSSWYNQPTAQLYHIGITPTYPYRVCSGQQDSGSVCVASRGNDGMITVRDWRPVGVIEYGYAAPDPLDADVVYGAGRNEVSKFHWSTGQVENVTPVPVRGDAVRADRTEPVLFSPLDPHTLYYAANVLYRTRDGGASWTAVSPDLTRPAPGVPASVGRLYEPAFAKQRGAIYALAASPRALDTLWAGTDDGLVWVTRDGGGHWTPVTPPGVEAWSKVTQIEASHYDADAAYVSVSRLRLDDLRPYVYRTRDGGRSWQSISAGLPDAPVNAVREDPVRRGLLYAATERAVWVSFDDGEHWDALQANLPHTSMRDLAVHGADLIVATHGRGFWVLDDVSRLRQLAPAKLRAPFLVTPAPAVRVPRSTWSDTPIPPDEPSAPNPPAGAAIDYYLPAAVTGRVTLEVLDAQGALVRRYASDDAPSPSAAEVARQLVPPYWLAEPQALARGAGMHRFVWDLRYPAPDSATHGYANSAVPHATPREPLGPVALPGAYTLRLSAAGDKVEAPLTLLPDPRVALSAAGYAAQLKLATELAGHLGESSRALLATRSLVAQLKALPPDGAAAEVRRAYAARLATLLEAPASAGESTRPLLPALQGRIKTLYEAVMRADAAPTTALAAATAAAAADLDGLMRTFRALAAELPAVNAQLRAARLAELRPELAPPVDRDVADEE